MTRSPARSASLLLIASGFVVWASAFSLLYGGLSVGCAFGWQQTMIAGISLQRFVLLLILGVHLVALMGLLIYCLRLPRRTDDGTAAFTRRVAIGSNAAALVATVWTGLVIPAVSACL
jgi:hydrogenase-4 membrane subunit HyfE